MPEKIEQLGRRRRRRSRHRGSDSSDLELLSDAHARMPRPGDVIADKYRIEELLGRGGMGAVYSATHVLSGKRAAVKWMLPAAGHVQELSERFIREARATARVVHPNVVDIYDVGQRDGSVYLVMELLQGESLAERLDRAPIDPTDAVALLMPALRGVAAAHAQGVIHRDLKPDNIFLCWAEDGEPRETQVLDFGISKIVADERRDLAMTASGTVMGTPYYMSPEQIRGFRDVDARADVYAFGVILYEMLADCFPYDAETYNELILKIATTDPVPLEELNPKLNPAIVAIVKRAMAREPSQRFQSVAELAAALEPFAGGVPFRLSRTPQGPLPMPTLSSALQTGAVVASAPVAAASAAETKRGRAGWMIAAAVIAVAIAAGAAWWATATPGPDAPPHVVKAADSESPVAPLQPASVAPAATVTGAVVAAPAAAEPAAAVPAVEAPAAPEATPAASSNRERGKDAETPSERRARKRAEAAAAAAGEETQGSSAKRAGLAKDWDDHLRPDAPAGRGGGAEPVQRPTRKLAGSLTTDDL